MSDTSGHIDPDRSVGQGSGEARCQNPPPRKRRGLRITLVSLASLVVFLGAVASERTYCSTTWRAASTGLP